MSYSAFDANGYLADVASGKGWIDFCEWARAQGGALRELATDGCTEQLTPLAEQIASAHFGSDDVKDVADGIAALNPDGVLIVSDGVGSVGVETAGKAPAWPQDRREGAGRRVTAGSGGSLALDRVRPIDEPKGDAGRRLEFARTTSGVAKDALDALAESAARACAPMLGEIVQEVRKQVGQDATKEDADAVMEGLLTRSRIRPLADEIEKHVLAAMINGAGNAKAWLERFQRRAGVAHGASIRTPSHSPNFTAVDPAAARKILADKLLLTTPEIDELMAGAYEVAWSVATVTDVSVLADLRDALDHIIESGGTMKDWLDALPDIFLSTGWSTTGYHAMNIFSTTLAHTYEAERYDFLKGGVGVEYLVFSAIDDERECESCGELDLKAWPADSFPDEYWPPVHYQCRCTVVPADHDQLDGLGAELQDEAVVRDDDGNEVHAMEGFEDAPSINGLNDAVRADINDTLSEMGYTLPFDLGGGEE